MTLLSSPELVPYGQEVHLGAPPSLRRASWSAAPCQTPLWPMTERVTIHCRNVVTVPPGQRVITTGRRLHLLQGTLRFQARSVIHVQGRSRHSALQSAKFQNQAVHVGGYKGAC